MNFVVSKMLTGNWRRLYQPKRILPQNYWKAILNVRIRKVHFLALSFTKSCIVSLRQQNSCQVESYTCSYIQRIEYRPASFLIKRYLYVTIASLHSVLVVVREIFFKNIIIHSYKTFSTHKWGIILACKHKSVQFLECEISTKRTDPNYFIYFFRPIGQAERRHYNEWVKFVLIVYCCNMIKILTHARTIQSIQTNW